MNHRKVNNILILFLCVCLLLVFTPLAKADELSAATKELLASGQVSAEVASRVNPFTSLYQVKIGDTLWDIANDCGGDWELIAAMNYLTDLTITPGEVLVLPVEKEVVYTVQRGDSLSQIAKHFEVSLTAMIDSNGIINPDLLAVGQELIIPDCQYATPVSNTRLRTVQAASRGGIQTSFAWPVTGRITSRFGPRNGGFHHGLDIAVGRGTPVKAATAGKVEFTGWRNAYGSTVIIDHGNAYKTLYAHNSEILVKEGQYVSSGEILAKAGATGNATGNHVHFEVIKDGERIDPLRILKR